MFIKTFFFAKFLSILSVIAGVANKIPDSNVGIHNKKYL